MTRLKLTSELLKSIAVYKNENPGLTISQIAARFNVPYHKARYAIDKYASDVTFLKGNAKGRIIASKLIAGKSDSVEILKNQIAFILAQIETNDKLSVSERSDVISKIVRIKKNIQEFELEAHLKRADAGIIAAVIRRFIPDATNEQIIKIYKEEIAKSNDK